jgi:23S rRNA (adenine2030-N6)-methyltransferase
MGYKETLKIEFELLNYYKNMNKCGLLVINPPNIKDEIIETMDYITRYVYSNQAHYNVETLKD